MDNKPLLLTYLALLVIIFAMVCTAYVLLLPDFNIEHEGLIVGVFKTDDATRIVFQDGFAMELKGDHGELLWRYKKVEQGRHGLEYYEYVGNPSISGKFNFSE